MIPHTAKFGKFSSKEFGRKKDLIFAETIVQNTN